MVFDNLVFRAFSAKWVPGCRPFSRLFAVRGRPNPMSGGRAPTHDQQIRKAEQDCDALSVLCQDGEARLALAKVALCA